MVVFWFVGFGCYIPWLFSGSVYQQQVISWNQVIDPGYFQVAYTLIGILYSCSMISSFPCSFNSLERSAPIKRCISYFSLCSGISFVIPTKRYSTDSNAEYLFYVIIIRVYKISLFLKRQAPYTIKAVLVTAPAHVTPVLLKWFVWYQTVKICYYYSISTVYRHYLSQGIPPFLHPYTAFLR